MDDQSMLIRRNPGLWLWGCAALSFLAVGVPYWQIPEDKLSFPLSLAGPGLLVILIASMLATHLGWAKVRKAIVVLGGAVPAAVLARVIVESGTDTAEHPLWAFELIIGFFVGAVASGPGAVLGAFPDLIRLLRRDPD